MSSVQERPAPADYAVAMTDAQLGAVLRSFPEPIFVLDRYGRYLHVLGGADAEHYHCGHQLIGKRMSEVLPADKSRAFLKQIRLALDERRTIRFRYQLSAQEVDGCETLAGPEGDLHFEAHIAPIIDANGQAEKALWIANNVSVYVRELLARDEHARELAQAASKDPLTGVLNRRGFEEAADERLSNAKAKASALALTDLDHFKCLNDTYGHRAGDQALKVAARRMRNALRPVDLIGRYGGEEFIIWLDSVDLEEAHMICERLRLAIGGIPVSFGALKIDLAVSVGLTPLDRGDTSLGLAIERADQALYRAKRTGRNRVCAVQTE